MYGVTQQLNYPTTTTITPLPQEEIKVAGQPQRYRGPYKAGPLTMATAGALPCWSPHSGEGLGPWGPEAGEAEIELAPTGSLWRQQGGGAACDTQMGCTRAGEQCGE